MTASPFDLRSCPRVAANEAAATRDLARVVASLPGSWQAALPPLGEATFAMSGIDVPPVSPAVLVLGVARGHERGR